MKNVYIGIDPDIRMLNAALLTGDKDKPVLQKVFIRRNKEGKGDEVVANASRMACRLVEDVIAALVGDTKYDDYDQIVTIVESQSMLHTQQMHKQGKKVNYDHIRRLSQVAGCLMGAFSNLSQRMVLVQPSEWKGQVPKHIHHGRIYSALNVGHRIAECKDGYGIPHVLTEYTDLSHDKINPGDFKDISDSVGLALYGCKEGM